MAAAVAHGIRNPLASIRSSAELAQEDGIEGVREAAADIMREVDRIDRWVRDLLRDALDEPTTSGPADLGSVVRSVLEELQPALARKGVRLELDLQPQLPHVTGDGGALSRVIDTLVANALDAMPGGGVLRLTARAMSGRPCVELCLADTGEGVPAEKAHEIFRPFFTTKGTGLGLGLALARSIVTRYGGTIEFASTRGSGTTETVRLPMAE
jgi:signal transduction histidine kinase